MKIIAQNGEFRINDVTIDMTEFSSSSVVCNGLRNFFRRFPAQKEVNLFEVNAIHKFISESNDFSISYEFDLIVFAVKFLGSFETSVKKKIIRGFAHLVNSTIVQPIIDVLSEYMPKVRIYTELFQNLLDFFSLLAEELENQYQTWRQSHKQYYNPLFSHLDIEDTKRYIELIKEIIYSFDSNSLTKDASQKLITFLFEWFAKKYTEFEEDADLKTQRANRFSNSVLSRLPTRFKTCDVCNGYYFKNI